MSTPTTNVGIAQFLQLNKLQIKNLLGTLNPPAAEFGPDFETRILVLADLLERLQYLKPEARTAILCGVWKTVNENNQRNILSIELLRGIYFADGAYCCWPGLTGWLDLNTGDTIHKLPTAPAETISYNLDVLEQQLQQKVAKVQGV